MVWRDFGKKSDFKMKNLKFKKGFTIVELLAVIGILIILTSITIPAFHHFQRESNLQNSTEEIINTLRLAQNKTLASEGAAQYGLYFDNTSTPHQYILFKGVDFASRDDSFDKINKIPQDVEIYEINLAGNETVFERITGNTLNSGNIKLRLRKNPTKMGTIYIEPSGKVSTTSFSPLTDSRIRDSRHVHIIYDRVIDTTTEKLTLTFNTSTTEEFAINNYLEGDQIYWEKEINVGGEIQKIKIHTHRLNNPDTLFSVHRDRRYNTKSLKIEISGDGSGTLIEYSADGLTTTNSSIYVEDSQWQ